MSFGKLIIIWELWRRRHALKHERKGVFVHRMIMNVTRHLRMLLKVRKPALDFLGDWPGILQNSVS